MPTPNAAVALCFALLACADPRLAIAHDPPSHVGPYAVDLVDGSGTILPTFQHRGRTYVLGAIGQRYLLRIRNASGRRVEVVASVDGRDVLDGNPAGWEKQGYLVEPYGEVTIDGFRLSEEAVAAFRFSSVQRSYAAQMSDARDVGVIGVAVFPERPPRPVYPSFVPPSYVPRAPRSKLGSGAEPEAAPAPQDSLADGASTNRAEKKSGLERKSEERRGLGTEFGEQHDSRVHQVSFERASARPEVVLTLRYDDRPGLLALGIDLDRRCSRGEVYLRDSAQPFRRSSFAQPPPGW